MQRHLTWTILSLSLASCSSTVEWQSDRDALPVLAHREERQSTRVDPPAQPQEREHQFELSASNDAVWLKYQTPIREADGLLAVRLFGNEEDAYIGNVNFQRTGEPLAEYPLTLGLGVSGYAGTIDVPDENFIAVAVLGSARYELPTTVPTRVATEVAYAPSVLVGSGGERLLDFDVRFEGDVNSFATLFLSYRVFDIDFTGPVDQKLEDAFQVGLRFVF